MNAQRVGLRALRQAAAKPNAFFSQNTARLAVANLQARPFTTEKVTPSGGQEILNAQRKNRPVSPHLSIYDVNQMWLGASIWTRITGGIFSGSLYVFATAYLAAPYLGWHLESASLAAAFATWPVAAKASLKFLAAWPFTFHLLNGTRHLVWDFAKGFSRPLIKQTSWGIWGASLGAALGLALLV